MFCFFPGIDMICTPCDITSPNHFLPLGTGSVTPMICPSSAHPLPLLCPARAHTVFTVIAFPPPAGGYDAGGAAEPRWCHGQKLSVRDTQVPAVTYRLQPCCHGQRKRGANTDRYIAIKKWNNNNEDELWRIIETDEREGKKVKGNKDGHILWKAKQFFKHLYCKGDMVQH